MALRELHGRRHVEGALVTENAPGKVVSEPLFAHSDLREQRVVPFRKDPT